MGGDRGRNWKEKREGKHNRTYYVIKRFIFNRRGKNTYFNMKVLFNMKLTGRGGGQYVLVSRFCL